MSATCGATVAAALDERPSEASSRSKKWMDQLSQVESRLLNHWDEFSAHRSDVQNRLKDIQDAMQRKSPRQDEHFELNLERCNRRVQQLADELEEVSSRMHELKIGADNGKDSLEGLRGRVVEKLQDLGTAFEDHQKDTAKYVEEALQDAATTSKRLGRQVAEELLRKMEELNGKLGDNMASVEEQAAAGQQTLRYELREVVGQMEALAPKASLEAEVRKVESRLEAALRARQAEFQVQLNDLTQKASNDAVRFACFEQQIEDMRCHSEALRADFQASKHKADRAEAKHEARLEEFQASLPGQLGRLRDEHLRLLRELQTTQHEELDDRVKHLREEITNGCLKEIMLRSDTLADNLRELGREQENEMASVQETLRNVTSRIEKVSADAAAVRVSVSGAQEETSKELSAVRNDFAQQLRQARQQLEDRQDQRFAEAASREDMEDLRNRLRSQLDTLGEELGRLGKTLESQAEGFSARETEWRRRMDQAEQSSSELRNWVETRDERFKAASMDLAEQVSQAREETLRLCRDNLEEACRTGQKQREKQDRSINDLQERLEGLLLTFQELGLRNLQGRLDALQGALAEQGTVQTERMEQLVEDSRQHSKALFAEAKAVGSQARELLDSHAAETRRSQEAQLRRAELLERQVGDSGAKLATLSERVEALRCSDAERLLQLEKVSKACTDISDARVALAGEMEANQRLLERQIEESARRLDGRLEATTAATSSRIVDGLAEAKAGARDLANAAERSALCQAREFTEQHASELKKQLQGCDESFKLELAKLREVQDAKSQDTKQHDENIGREISQLRVTEEAHHKELRQELRQALHQVQSLEAQAAASELRSRELGQLKLADEAILKEISQLKASEELQGKDLLKLEALLEAANREWRQKDEQQDEELGRLQLAEEVLRREAKQREETLEKSLKQVRAALDTSGADIRDLRDRTDGMGREIARKTFNEDLIRKELEERTGAVTKDLRHLQAKQEALSSEFQHNLQSSLESTTEEFRKLFGEGLATARADAAEREGRLASRFALTGQEAEEFRRGLDGQVRKQLGAMKEQVAELQNQTNERLKQQSTVFGGQLQETKSALEEHIRSQMSATQERVADVQKDARDRTAQISEDINKAVAELRATSHSLGLRVQSNQDHAADFQKKSEEAHHNAEDRLQRMSRDLRQQVLDLQNETKTTNEQLAAQQQQHAEVASRQVMQLTTQLQDSKDLGEELQLAVEASKELSAKLRTKAEEQNAALQETIKAMEKSALDQSRKLEQRLQDIQKQSSNRIADGEGRLGALQEDLAQKEKRDKKQAEELAKLVVQFETLEREVEQNEKGVEAQRSELTKLIETRHEVAIGSSKEEVREHAMKLQKDIDKVRMDSNHDMQQLGKSLKDLDAKTKTQHEEHSAKYASMQAQASENKDAASAVATELSRALDAADGRWATKLKTELDSLAVSVKEAKEDAQSSLEKVKVQLSARLDQADVTLKDFVSSASRDAEERGKRYTEAQERLGSRLVETSEALRRQGVEHTQAVAEVRAFASDGLARVGREALDSNTELRRKLDDWAERAAGEVREVQIALLARISESQAEGKQHLAEHKHASSLGLTELGKQQMLQDERIKDLAAIGERDRACAEEQRKLAQSSLKDLADKSRAQLSEQAFAAEQALKVASENWRSALDECASGLEAQIAATEKSLSTVREELPALARECESTRQSHASALEELKKASLDRHQQLLRKSQTEAEKLAALAEKVSAAQDEWKSRHQEAQQSNSTAFAGLQATSDQMAKQFQDECSKTQDELRSSHAELAKMQKTQKEAQLGALADLSRQHEDWMAKVQRGFDEVDSLTAQSRLINIVSEHVDGLVRGVTQHELQTFQREALNSVEWKLERCVQWLHGANVKLGLNPQGTMFSTDRFREMLFDEAVVPAAGCSRRSNPARPARGVVRGRAAG